LGKIRQAFTQSPAKTWMAERGAEMMLPIPLAKSIGIIHLTAATAAGLNACTVLETPTDSGKPLRQTVAIFTPMSLFMVGKWAAIQHPQGENCQRTICRFEVPDHPSKGGQFENSDRSTT
jgi:hypothetical protein